MKLILPEPGQIWINKFGNKRSIEKDVSGNLSWRDLCLDITHKFGGKESFLNYLNIWGWSLAP